VIECKGPTNTRVYTVAVYFRGRRLASAMGHSIQQAEMNAAKKALEISQGTNTRAIQSGGKVVF
jgi:ribonuclease-3